ncbi:FtsK/SpoIIIE domain-containing protein [Streptomyces winkii]|uniref:FtsK/SpoIIIE domain-containing protein n=1 Tax=Streptomyces winkii TaxID=3051178 RepID=UPI0028D7E6A0|nr:FtsK/SpoIIIE domain-containing protein [Streptomyces sp. DSM 40971]
MQIRLTVTLGPRGGGQGAGGAAGAPSAGSACDVLITAPSGTPLSAVTGGLVSTAAAAVSGSGSGAGGSSSGAGAGGPSQGAGAESAADSTAAVYAGTERLDPHRQILGEPPLLDGAVVSLHGPALPAAVPALAAYGSAKARLHVISGPDAGGIHLLQGGVVRLGRAAEADVPLDDPDVSRLHCAVTVSDGGAVTVADLGSTNGTSLDGAPVGGTPVLFRPGSTLRVGESALRVETSAPGALPESAGAGSDGLSASAPVPGALPTTPDGNGQLRLAAPAHGREAAARSGDAAGASASAGLEGADGADGTSRRGGGPEGAGSGPEAEGPRESAAPPAGDGAHGYAPGGPFPDGGTTHGSGIAQHARYAQQFPPEGPGGPGAPEATATGGAERPRARGLGAWARRFAGGRQEEQGGEPSPSFARPAGTGGPGAASPHGADAATHAPSQSEDGSRPDPATILLTALGPGPRLWEREPAHPEAMTVRIGTAHRGHGLPGAPVTVDLREAGALGLAGPRPRLTGMARSVLAQLAALHGPSTLEMVLISADRSREAEARIREWSWLGWLPHLRPAHGQDCRLLTAYDRDQAAARAAELVHRLEESGEHAGHGAGPRSVSPGSMPAPGPYTLLVVDGDPGSASLRDTVARLAAEGPRAGIHLLCLAETPAATPSSPVSETVRAACAASAAFRECGALALLSGAVATAVRVVHRGATAPGGPGAPGTVCTLDAVSAAWAERFARAMAPLRESQEGRARSGAAARSVVTLPRSSRLLDELGLARATPAALLSRWAEPGGTDAGTSGSGEAAEEGSAAYGMRGGQASSGGRSGTGPGAPGSGAGPAAGRATLVFGAGPRGALQAELGLTRGHALVTGPTGSGKTELLRSLAASLSVGSPPDRLQLVLLDGDGAAGDGLHICLELPHARHHLAANDPALMREFAQSLSGELKRRAELIGEESTYEGFARQYARAGHRLAAQQRRRAQPAAAPDAAPVRSSRDEPGTLRLRTQTGPVPSPGAGERAEATTSTPTGATVQHLDAQAAPLPRIVIIVDDFDTLADPSLGNPGRPAAGSVMRALESVARDGARLGMHIVAASGRPDRTAETAVAHAAALRAELSGHGGGAGGEGALPGRGTLIEADGTATAFQAGRITGRIPRTATQRPTVVQLDWTRAGDPPARRPVRELGNGPTDLALLASAVGRAARSLGLDRQETGTPAANRSRSGQDEVLES